LASPADSPSPSSSSSSVSGSSGGGSSGRSSFGDGEEEEEEEEELPPGQLPLGDFRNRRFKLIPLIVDGPTVVTWAVGAKPVLMGQKVRRRRRRRREQE